MLETDYKQILDRLIASVSWSINLPCSKDEFFNETGQLTPCGIDGRAHARMRARTHGIAYYEKTLPAFPRTSEPLGLYSADFSKVGLGFVASREYLPEEQIRVLLPTMWIIARIVRCNQMAPECYSVGGVMLAAHKPSPEAFRIDSTVAM